MKCAVQPVDLIRGAAVEQRGLLMLPTSCKRCTRAARSRAAMRAFMVTPRAFAFFLTTFIFPLESQHIGVGRLALSRLLLVALPDQARELHDRIKRE